MNKLGVLAANR